MCEIGWFSAIVRTIPAQDLCVCVCVCVCVLQIWGAHPKTRFHPHQHGSGGKCQRHPGLHRLHLHCSQLTGGGQARHPARQHKYSSGSSGFLSSLFLCSWISVWLKSMFFFFVKISILLWKMGIKIISSVYERCRWIIQGMEQVNQWFRKRIKNNFLFQELVLILSCVRRPLIIRNPTPMHQTDSLLIDCCYAWFMSRFKN